MLSANVHSRGSIRQARAAVASRIWGVSQALMNLFVIGLFVLQVIASVHYFVISRSLHALGLLVISSLFMTLFVFRSPAKDESPSAAVWLLGIAGTIVPLLLRPGTPSAIAPAGDLLQLIGFVLVAAALLSLRRSFGIVAANRGVRSGGLYRFVRHPVYFAELTLLLGFVLANPAYANIIIWLCECLLQYARACAEERLLSADPAYLSYRSRVRYRLVPGIV
jgi:protein-S-isoprenylcysteine O-methyltransferase Ste14